MADVATVLLLPGLLLYLGFNAGGYFAGSTGWATVAVALALAVRVAISGSVLSHPGRPLLMAASGLALFGLWTLLSGSWADNTARAVIEFDRALLYLLVLMLFGSLARPRSAFRFLPLGLALAGIVLCAAGLVTRVLPEQWPFEVPEARGRLAYPITYSNGLGILASVTIVVCLHTASWERERMAMRILAAAALPMLAATLVLTFSRGAILAGAVGVLLYAVVGRPRGLAAGLLASLPFVLLAANAAYEADLLATKNVDLTMPAVQRQGEELARTVGLSMLGAATAIALLIPLERRALRSSSIRRPPKGLVASLGTAAALGAVVAALVFGPNAYESIREEIQGTASGEAALTRDRLLGGDLANLGRQTRLQYWDVALDAFAREPLHGTGIGTFAEQWARERSIRESVTEGHSVYVETLGELGLIGLGLIALVLVTMLWAFVAGSRKHARAPFAAALAAGSAWAIHAGIDWDWELPALTLWLFAFGGCALAAWLTRGSRIEVSPRWRALAGAGVLLLAITPAAVALSQSRLDRSISGFLAGDCARARSLAASASSALPPRPEPYEIIAYCASLEGKHRRALGMIREALDRNPTNWELVYGLARVRAAAGQDPRSAVRRLRQMNPLEPVTQTAVELFSGDQPGEWRAGARAAPVPLP